MALLKRRNRSTFGTNPYNPDAPSFELPRNSDPQPPPAMRDEEVPTKTIDFNELVEPQEVERTKVWRKRSYLVIRHDAELCDKCFRCNADANGQRYEERVKVNAPTTFASLIVSGLCMLCGGILLAALVNKRQSMTVEIGICEQHVQLRKKLAVYCLVVAFATVFGFALAMMLSMPKIGLSIAFVGGIGIVVLHALRPALAVANSNDEVVLLRGCSKKYLANFPKYTKSTW